MARWRGTHQMRSAVQCPLADRGIQNPGAGCDLPLAVMADAQHPVASDKCCPGGEPAGTRVGRALAVRSLVGLVSPLLLLSQQGAANKGCNLSHSPVNGRPKKKTSGNQLVSHSHQCRSRIRLNRSRRHQEFHPKKRRGKAQFHCRKPVASRV